MIQASTFDGAQGSASSGAPDGTFRLDRLPAGDVALHISAPDAGMLDVVVAVAAGDVVPEPYALAPPRDVVVNVHDDDATPLHVAVQLLIGDPRLPAGLAPTDDAGRVVLPGIPAGEHDIVLDGAVSGPAGPAGSS